MKNKKILILTSIIIGVLVVVLGLSFALFTFDRSGANQELVLGDIWMKYTESNGISLENALPGNDYSKYFEFSITGTNTYAEKDIWYDIRLAKGDVPEGRTEEDRIADEYLKFRLVEVNDNVETEIFTDKTYGDLSNKTVHVAIIPKGTNDYIKTYRLYMVISEKLIIGNVEGAISSEAFERLFGSIKVATTGDFTEKEVPLTITETIENAILANTDDTCTNLTVVEDGITYISGSRECIDFNYVWYSGKLWRITAIYPDGTMKMITNDILTTIAYGENVSFYTNESVNSWIYQWLNQDFLDTLYNNDNIIEEAKWNTTAGNGSVDYKLPETTIVNAKIGLLDSYEYYLSYKNSNDSDGYLNIGYAWWLLNPYDLTLTSVRTVGSRGNSGSDPSTAFYGVRPMIKFKSVVEFSGGSGTVLDPYTIKGDREDIVENTTFLNTRSSGEYVVLNDELFRIVEIENNTTKLNKVDYVRDSNDEVIKKSFASTITYGATSNSKSVDYWDYYLNNTWLKEFDSTYNEIEGISRLLEKGTYYLGSIDYTTGYKMSICQTESSIISTNECEKTNNVWIGYVGLPRYGEMFATQLGEGYSQSSIMWLITPYYSTSVWGINLYADGYTGGFQNANAVRPSIHVNSQVKITGGTGLPNDPFEISL